MKKKALYSWCPFTPGKHQAASYTPCSGLLQATGKTCRDKPKCKPDASNQQLLYLQSPQWDPFLLRDLCFSILNKQEEDAEHAAGTALLWAQLQVLLLQTPPVILFYVLSLVSASSSTSSQKHLTSPFSELKWRGFVSAIWNGFSPAFQHFSNCIWESHQ